MIVESLNVSSNGRGSADVIERVACIIVHHAGEEMLSACVQSVLDTRGIGIEVVVVANACSEALPTWVEEDPRTHVVRLHQPLGFAEANNRGVEWYERHAGGATAYLFLNNDAIVESETVAELLSVLKTDPLCGAVGPEIRIWGAEAYLNSLGLNVTEFGEAWDEGIGRPVEGLANRNPEAEVVALTGAAVLIRAEALHEVGGWSRLYRYYMEDIDLCLRLQARGWKVKNFRGARAFHAVSATSGGITDMKRFYSWRNQFVILAVHWPAGLLLRVGPRLAAVQLGVFIRRLRIRAFADARLQARSWLGALWLAPWALIERWRTRGNNSWSRFLVPAGTVPVIELPEVREKPWHARSNRKRG